MISAQVILQLKSNVLLHVDQLTKQSFTALKLGLSIIELAIETNQKVPGNVSHTLLCIFISCIIHVNVM